MTKKLLLILAVLLSVLFLFLIVFSHSTKIIKTPLLSKIPSLSHLNNSLEERLQALAPDLNTTLINKIVATLICAKTKQIEHNQIITIIDYSLPSNKKRLWVINLETNQLLFHTYVSHGIKSGALLSASFSNQYNSKASSIGVYKTDKTYYGREGLSLKLSGLEHEFNDNASNRSIVMHGGWYMDNEFIAKYGRAGRSWGCPAVPLNLATPIINAIKDNSLFIIYYPNEHWFLKSKFLSCNDISFIPSIEKIQTDHLVDRENTLPREEILLAFLSKNKQEGSELIATVTADNYRNLFHTAAPLTRMLRRQINHIEYIALSNTEFKQLVIDKALDLVSFVTPVIVLRRGYYATEMHLVNLGKIKNVTTNGVSPEQLNSKSYIISFEQKSFIQFNATNRFIRWLGL